MRGLKLMTGLTLHCPLINVEYFIVWYCELCTLHPHVYAPSWLVQVSGEKQKVPQAVMVAVNIFVSDAFTHRLFNGMASNQVPNIVTCMEFLIHHKLLYDMIAAGSIDFA